ncbi:3-oxoacyl-[acyl-carrier-protein] synthase III C-terminal domain-containing protein [Rubinisphaera margarita]|uniref:3-oxoacyl-[acyl-carrier-protein] synthase III C-terminal domain-containing protein n=1 Tax=Rubinisphaera margarita TaxID=2909586 RepID=UPI001EE90D18|nr:3-oxoacyl-[acyl-carrier-protein] synthase III C-terminal domain-containing protein [Rubinisphaera margarita]MCG6157650.1 hypothetical protein [Rubinisphaera margarita]
MPDSVYINALGKCLPGHPVSNSEMEDYIGRIRGRPSRLGKIALRHNQIQQRHYAIQPDGSTNWTVARLQHTALEDALRQSEIVPRDLSFLACGTSQNDVLLPGIGSMVHAESRLPPLEVASFQSVCASSMMALKYALLQIQSGEHTTAAVTAGEFASRFFRPGHYEGTVALNADEGLPLAAEYLRWTLSDGAGAAILEAKPNSHGRSLRIDWIRLRSFADRFDACMVAGKPLRQFSESPQPWNLHATLDDAIRQGAFFLWQDFDLLEQMLPVWVNAYVTLIREGLIRVDEIDLFLCHYSTHGLRKQLVPLMKKAGCMIPEERWFNNLYTRGNTGSASLLLMLEELLNEGRLVPGQRLLCAVPESGRAIVSFMQLTVI